MACRRRTGGPCLRKLNYLSGRLGWAISLGVEHSGRVYNVVIEPTGQEPQRFMIRHKALVFVMKAARKAGLA